MLYGGFQTYNVTMFAYSDHIPGSFWSIVVDLLWSDDTQNLLAPK